MRNYDENPIIINDYGALFLAGWYIILYSILVFVFAFSDYGLLYRIYLIALPASFLLFCLYNTYVFAPRVFKQKPSFARFLRTCNPSWIFDVMTNVIWREDNIFNVVSRCVVIMHQSERHAICECYSDYSG